MADPVTFFVVVAGVFAICVAGLYAEGPWADRLLCLKQPDVHIRLAANDKAPVTKPDGLGHW